MLARRIQRRPAVVVFDRHFFCDYYASAVAPGRPPRALDARLHGYVLRRWYPRPDLTLFLDAPPEVLVARKAGETVERLARRRLEYLDLRDVMPAFQVVDADRPVGDVVDDVVGRIVAFVVGGPSDAGTSGDGKELAALADPEQAPVPASPVELAASVTQPTIADSTSTAAP